jgi:hypothetical protein
MMIVNPVVVEDASMDPVTVIVSAIATGGDGPDCCFLLTAAV